MVSDPVSEKPFSFCPKFAQANRERPVSELNPEPTVILSSRWWLKVSRALIPMASKVVRRGELYQKDSRDEGERLAWRAMKLITHEARFIARYGER
ncbi:hypothetical protein MTR_8g045040 [Medicago truncatula]|uniref:Uncharacterized protein n=1 Tax=Medicago truncatula TaxID=3880 RepID=G7L7Q2_MEDTR|nr:hypothetical protein MTR_8g045040 [Medicago truncatula]